jgi:U32 family peptidase
MNAIQSNPISRPEILAPAGNRASFLSAIAAGADAVYCGLKQFSARMAAANFTFEELAALTRLAHARGIKVYVAFNTLVKPGECYQAETFVRRLEHEVNPDALIVQDLSLLALARKTGFKKELHLSTLANVSFPEALNLVRRNLSAHRVVLPRELNIDEIKMMADACPDDMGLEVFIHGALCYAVSGRCYWSSYFGGKSGLRGRCVQPCRRRYRMGHGNERYFSCQDLSLDVLVKVLLTLPQIKTWKIEGRKKGPHYVYYTVTAYKMLRDHGSDPKKKRAALGLLDRALGRVSTHYGFLPQRPQNPVKVSAQTGSGLLLGHVQGSKTQSYLVPREAILKGDVLRIGYEDDAWHMVRRMKQSIPARGRYHLKGLSHDRRVKGAPVFLVDRQEDHLRDLILQLEKELVFGEPLKEYTERKTKPSVKTQTRRPVNLKSSLIDMQVHRKPVAKGYTGVTGLWLSQASVAACPKNRVKGIWWWLPPVLWPGQTKALQKLVGLAARSGARRFVLNMPWQSILFKGHSRLTLWAGPFCNIANGIAVESLERLGFSGAIVSPELGKTDFLALPEQSGLPLGIVLSANWPLCISRTLSEEFKIGTAFTSPKGETGWVAKHGEDFWLFPNWKLDILKKKELLAAVGYTVFVHLSEPVPKKISIKQRPGLWNWNLGMK